MHAVFWGIAEMKIKFLSAVVCCLVWQCVAVEALRADMVISGSTPATNDRFEDNSNFLSGTAYAGQDFSGIGQTNGSQWATLISPNVAIAAHHVAPSATLSFYPGNDATVAPVDRMIDSTFRIPNTDLRLIVLDQNVPSSIAHYSFATQLIDGTAANPNIYQGDTALTVGLSSVTGQSAGDHRQAFGQNIIDGYNENNSFNGTDNDFFVLVQNPVVDSSPGSPFSPPYPDTAVPFESLVQAGDSGAPIFTQDTNGDLLLLGVNSVRFTFFDDVNGNRVREADETLFGNGSGPSYLGNVSSTIEDFIQANAVPEPSSFAVLVLFAIGIQSRRRRQ